MAPSNPMILSCVWMANASICLLSMACRLLSDCCKTFPLSIKTQTDSYDNDSVISLYLLTYLLYLTLFLTTFKTAYNMGLRLKKLNVKLYFPHPPYILILHPNLPFFFTGHFLRQEQRFNNAYITSRYMLPYLPLTTYLLCHRVLVSDNV